MFSSKPRQASADSRRGRLPVVFLLATVALGGLIAFGLLTGYRQTAAADDFDPKVVIPRSFPPIKDVAVMSAADADRVLQESEIVLGVSIDGKPRAYPINMLTGPSREIINDTLGGKAIAATW